MGEHLAHADVLAVADDDEGAHGKLNRHGVIGTCDLDLTVVGVKQANQRPLNVLLRNFS